MTVPKWAVIKAYTPAMKIVLNFELEYYDEVLKCLPPLAPDRNLSGFTTFVHREPAITPDKYTPPTLHHP